MLNLNSEMSLYVSDKIKVFSVVSTMLVLYIHSGFHDYEVRGMLTVEITQKIISQIIGKLAVPLFFTISGFLFFNSFPKGIFSVFEKMQKRVHTLLIPYLFACIFCVVLSFMVASIPWTSKFMNANILPLFKEKWHTIFLYTFYNYGEGNGPVAFQLWFLRDLIITVLFSPILYFMIKYLKWGSFFFFLILNYLHIGFIPVSAMFWFTFGALLVGTNTNRRRPLRGIVLFPLFVIISSFQEYNPNFWMWRHSEIPLILLGCIAFWQVFDAVISSEFKLKEHFFLSKLAGCTFFIYLYHVPALNVPRKLIVALLGKNEWGYLFSYLIAPWIFVILALIVSGILKLYVPRFYGILTGGR